MLGIGFLSSQAEVWTWALYYAAILGMAFGSAYYHLKPDDNRVLWDTLPVSIIAIYGFRDARAVSKTADCRL